MIYLIRHAEKQNNNVNSILSEKGKQEAFLYGKKLRENNIKLDFIMSSPIQRCIETSNEIRKGYGKKISIKTSNLLGDPGVFIKDDKKAMDVFNKYKLLEIINKQLSFEELKGFRNIKDGSEELLNLIKFYKNKNIIMISHDAIITPFIYYLKSIEKIKESNIVDYLNGYNIYPYKGKILIEEFKL